MDGYSEPENEAKARKVREIVHFYTTYEQKLTSDQVLNLIDEANKLSLELADYLRLNYPDSFNFKKIKYDTEEEIEFEKRSSFPLSELPENIQKIWQDIELKYKPKVHDYYEIKINAWKYAEVLRMYFFVEENKVYGSILSFIPEFFDFMERMGLTEPAYTKLYGTKINSHGYYWPNKVRQLTSKIG